MTGSLFHHHVNSGIFFRICCNLFSFCEIPFRYTHASTIGEDSRKEVFISVYDLNTFTVVKTNPMQTEKEGKECIYGGKKGKAPDLSVEERNFYRK